ncbi:NPCBM/NEW2 domain-containing protein [Brevibacillus ruminantium]|uniref:NPCBM/NEW2 domain-containing protein n=1 Tax=Brevibacillus ruminantium TaxID=2950604 RepID=A0ABY4WJS5_9BACL|nr:NPCBM/NEW2 domain-containing protein [Brevibacillus ruminantium]USG66317.1 NPCBM/NEW2 domain-containing protein [Brevibacillus ruminantium]
MMKKNTKLGFMSGFLLGSIFFSGLTYAATQSIPVDFKPIKFMVDGKLRETNDAFLYNGVPYAPVAFVGTAAGKKVTWDANASTVTIGGPAESVGSETRLSSLKYSIKDGYLISAFKDNWDKGVFSAGGTIYDHGLGYTNITSVANDSYSITRQAFKIELNGSYKELSGVVAVDDKSPNKTDPILWRIKGDGKLLHESQRMTAGQSQAVQVNVAGVKTLELEMRKVSGSDKANIHAFFGNPLLR